VWALWVTHKDECWQLDSKAFIIIVACQVCVVYVCMSMSGTGRGQGVCFLSVSSCCVVDKAAYAQTDASSGQTESWQFMSFTLKMSSVSNRQNHNTLTHVDDRRSHPNQPPDPITTNATNTSISLANDRKKSRASSMSIVGAVMPSHGPPAGLLGLSIAFC